MCELGDGGSLGKTWVNAAVIFFGQLQTNLWNAKAISLLCFSCLQLTFCFHSANLSPIINASVAPVLSWPYYIWKEHSSSLLCEMKEMLIILSRERKLSAAMFPCAEYSCTDWTAIWSQTRVGVGKSTAGRQLSYFWRRRKKLAKILTGTFLLLVGQVPNSAIAKLLSKYVGNLETRSWSVMLKHCLMHKRTNASCCFLAHEALLLTRGYWIGNSHFI